MGKTNFSTIHNQPNLMNMSGLTFQPAASNRLIPGTNIDRPVGQQVAQTLGVTEQHGFTRDLPSNPAKLNRLALVNSDQKSGKILNTCYSFNRSQFSNFL